MKAEGYNKAVQEMKKKIDPDYHQKFEKYWNFFSIFDRKSKANWMLAYVKTYDFEDMYHSDELMRAIDNLLRFLHMKMEYLQVTDDDYEYVIFIGGVRYFKE
jgi:hypothetical protein